MNNQESGARIVFIVGNSRSGTTMMAMILGNHPDIFKFLELHFFEEMWTPDDKNKKISYDDAVKIVSRLIAAQTEDYIFQGDPRRFRKEAEDIVNTLGTDKVTSEQAYKAFLFYLTSKGGKLIPCENTPRNVFYLDEILTTFPDARVINMVRDPRDILLSQKNKWKRWFFGSRGIPFMEAVRLFINYHPVTISKLWNSSVSAAEKFSHDKRILSLRYEDLISEPEKNISKICNFIGIGFEDGMFEIPTGGSSHAKDDISDQKGIIRDRVGNWKKGGLDSAEVYICQRITGPFMKRYDYSVIAVKPNPLKLTFYFMSFPLKILMALILNLKRMKNVFETLKRRLK